LLLLSTTGYGQSTEKQLPSIKSPSLEQKHLSNKWYPGLHQFRKPDLSINLKQKFKGFSSKPGSEIKPQAHVKSAMPILKPDSTIQFHILALRPDSTVQYHLRVKKPQ
jgi:hypothetical protein